MNQLYVASLVRERDECDDGEAAPEIDVAREDGDVNGVDEGNVDVVGDIEPRCMEVPPVVETIECESGITVGGLSGRIRGRDSSMLKKGWSTIRNTFPRSNVVAPSWIADWNLGKADAIVPHAIAGSELSRVGVTPEAKTLGSFSMRC